MERTCRSRLVLTLSAVLVGGATAMAQAPASSGTSPSERSGADAAGREAGRLADLLEKNPASPSKAKDHVAGLFLLDIASGRATLIADESDPGVGYCGCPDWSRDGKRILFDAMHADKVAESHIKMMEVVDGRPVTSPDIA